MIRVAVVDDQDLVRAGFVLLLRSAPDIEVVGEARRRARGGRRCAGVRRPTWC